MLGDTIQHYKVGQKLGEGGMGEVYLAEDVRLGRPVALKFLPAALKADPDSRARLLNEARAVRQEIVGGADFGPGPYLKVPNREPGDDDPDFEVVNRVFCPWGYPPDPVRAFRRNLRMRLERVDLVQVAPAAWEWRLTVRPR